MSKVTIEVKHGSNCREVIRAVVYKITEFAYLFEVQTEGRYTNYMWGSGDDTQGGQFTDNGYRVLHVGNELCSEPDRVYLRGPLACLSFNCVQVKKEDYDMSFIIFQDTCNAEHIVAEWLSHIDNHPKAMLRDVELKPLKSAGAPSFEPVGFQPIYTPSATPVFEPKEDQKSQENQAKEAEVYNSFVYDSFLALPYACKMKLMAKYELLKVGTEVNPDDEEIFEGFITKARDRGIISELGADIKEMSKEGDAKKDMARDVLYNLMSLSHKDRANILVGNGLVDKSYDDFDDFKIAESAVQKASEQGFLTTLGKIVAKIGEKEVSELLKRSDVDQMRRVGYDLLDLSYPTRMRVMTTLDLLENGDALLDDVDLVMKVVKKASDKVVLNELERLIQDERGNV